MEPTLRVQWSLFFDEMEPVFRCCGASFQSVWHIVLTRAGYLGKTEFSNWRQAIFEQTMKKKQRKEGYERLEELCRDLMTELRREDLVKP